MHLLEGQLRKHCMDKYGLLPVPRLENRLFHNLMSDNIPASALRLDNGTWAITP